MNLIDWMRATAEWMAADRPDAFDSAADALNQLELWMEQVRYDPIYLAGIESGGYLLTHSDEDGVEEWQLHKTITSCAIFQPENEVLALGHTHGSQAISVHPGLPDVIEDAPEL